MPTDNQTPDTTPSESEPHNPAQTETVTLADSTSEPEVTIRSIGQVELVPFYPDINSKYTLRAGVITAVPSGDMVPDNKGWFCSRVLEDEQGPGRLTFFLPDGVFNSQYKEVSIGCYTSRVFHLEVIREPKEIGGKEILANTLVIYNEQKEPILTYHHGVDRVVSKEELEMEFIDITNEEAKIIDNPVVWTNGSITASVVEGGQTYQFFAPGPESDYAEVLTFQNKPISAVGVNGVVNEAVIAVLLDRIQFLDIQLPCVENKTAIDGLNIALAALETRAAKR